ncbi:hypothetical protein QVD99_000346 [Batrachochytrium dendrobatidis]|nr:hypothetical protein QVD99_000346 [Batrachochytrium dendrobatidis]
MTHSTAHKNSSQNCAISTAIVTRDLAALRKIAVSPGGFRSRKARIQSWHVLLGLDRPDSSLAANDSVDGSPAKTCNKKILPHVHPSYTDTKTDLVNAVSLDTQRQVALDTARSFVQFTTTAKPIKQQPLDESIPRSSLDSANDGQVIAPTQTKSISYWSRATVDRNRAAIKDVILRVLQEYPCLNYYQGYHDIASVIHMLYKSRPQSSKVLSRMTILHLLDFMEPTMTTSTTYTFLIHLLLKKIDHDLYIALKPCGDVGTTRQRSNSSSHIVGMYALSWIITAFTHDLDRVDAALRVMDGLVAYGTCFLVYIAAAFLHFGRNDIIGKFGSNHHHYDMHQADDDEVMPRLHTYLTSGVVNSEMVDHVLVDAGKMLKATPIADLIHQHKQSSSIETLTHLHDACGFRFDQHMQMYLTDKQHSDLHLQAIFCDVCAIEEFKARCKRLAVMARRKKQWSATRRWVMRRRYPIGMTVASILVVAMAVVIQYWKPSILPRLHLRWLW